MEVKELIKRLDKIKDKDLDVRVVIPEFDDENYWLSEVEVSNKGDSGYELHGEVRLIGNE